eukprot:IDg2936t1
MPCYWLAVQQKLCDSLDVRACAMRVYMFGSKHVRVMSRDRASVALMRVRGAPWIAMTTSSAVSAGVYRGVAGAALGLRTLRLAQGHCRATLVAVQCSPAVPGSGLDLACRFVASQSSPLLDLCGLRFVPWHPCAVRTLAACAVSELSVTMYVAVVAAF